MQNIDWANLGFQYMDTNSHIVHVWRDGAWSKGELVRDPYVKMHIAASALHYGQAAFEGLKGLELFYSRSAPESIAVGMFYQRDGQLIQHNYETYHYLIDEEPPVWQKDAPEM